MAPVKAPFSWPKISLSRRSSGMAAQAYTSEKGGPRAIQLYEWASTTRAEIVNRACDQLFADAGFSLNQNGGIRRRDLFDLFERRFQRRTGCL
jgi:hypothetical protein